MAESEQLDSRVLGARRRLNRAARTTGMTENQTRLFEEPESQLNLFVAAAN